MPTVLILDVTGYLSLPLAKSLLRSGNYIVYELTPTPVRANALLQNEVLPVNGNVSDPNSFIHRISSIPIDVVINATPYEGASALLDAVKAVSKSRITSLNKTGSSGPKLGFVYVSSSWVLGNQLTLTSDTLTDTTLAKGKQATTVAWQHAHEQAILASRDVLDVAIVRPSQMYGSWGWGWNTYFGPLLAAQKSGSIETIRVPAIGTDRLSIVHVDDVATGVHSVIDRIHGLLGSWPVFNFIGESLPLRDILEGAKASLGVRAPLHYAGTDENPSLQATGSTTNNRSSSAAFVLGWQAKRHAFIQNLTLYVHAWEAAQP